MDADTKKSLEKLADITKFVTLVAAGGFFGHGTYELFAYSNLQGFANEMMWSGGLIIVSILLAGIGGFTREDIIIIGFAILLQTFSWGAFKFQATGDDSTWGLKQENERLREDLDAKNAVLLWMGKKYGVDVAKEVEKTKATRRALRGEGETTVVGDEESTNGE